VTTVFFARHGESEANTAHTFANRGRGSGLTGQGRRQAAELASRLAASGARELHSSPLTRCTETAAIVGAAIGLPVVVRDELREYDVGHLEGQSGTAAQDEYWDMQRRWLLGSEWDARHPGGESYREIVGRLAAYVESVRSGPVIAITHGGLLRMALPRIAAGFPPAESLRRMIPNGGLLELRCDGSTADVSDRYRRAGRGCSLQPW
jgi:broad specificity phosphatase PhoE